ncbi:Evolutionarily conserved signaling intermediate in Toll pathway, mitochondrial [Chionoecetes opilio]|uniref:Evolutionarily conserved signaling intermediate in Toll pathway, mitochondrial n=1 Tax=Chionoecetes opilio TaxID=41210 RepID=A0A8J5CKE1_CHIOP|nr:Evolutionarily conserved signaling intermediate in Toll pathway, mitochondrial [Chionoecetes opilio]
MSASAPLYSLWSRVASASNGWRASLSSVASRHHYRRNLTTTAIHSARKEDPMEKTSLTVQSYFNTKDRNKGTFLAACEVFTMKGPQLRGHVEFIYSALKLLEEYGVQKDLEVYKRLLDLMPKAKMIPTNVFQQEFMHYPKQQQCAIDTLDMMEINGRNGT